MNQNVISFVSSAEGSRTTIRMGALATKAGPWQGASSQGTGGDFHPLPICITTSGIYFLIGRRA
jgi:hypothetical protein